MNAAAEKDLRHDLKRLGIDASKPLIVHSSLSSLGHVEGGPATVVQALLGVLGEQGNLAMPAATPQCQDPAAERFDRLRTPTQMGAIAETFRNWPGTLRSNHPLESVCARGPRAAEITADHPWEFSEGPGTPFGRLHDLDSWILLLGVGFNRCTALHYAETVSTKRRLQQVGFTVEDNGQRRWVEVQNVADDNDRHFPVIGQQYLETGRVQEGTIARAPALLFSMTDLVELSSDYFDRAL